MDFDTIYCAYGGTNNNQSLAQITGQATTRLQVIQQKGSLGADDYRLITCDGNASYFFFGGDASFPYGTYPTSITSGGSSGSSSGTVTIEGMSNEDFNTLWPLLLGLMVSGYIVKRLIAVLNP